MIEIKKYPEVTYTHFDPEGNVIGVFNELENLDLRCQIAEQKLSGYYLYYKGMKLFIDENGQIVVWPQGLWGDMEILYAKLFSIRKKDIVPPVKDKDININSFIQKPARLYNPNDEFIGVISTEHQLHDVRIQIKHKQLENYYLMFNDVKIWIDRDGRIDFWPTGFFDRTEHQLMELL